MSVKRGEIYYCKMDGGLGSEQKADSPVVVLQNDVGNKYSPTTIVAMITSSRTKKNLPTHVEVKKCGLDKDSIVMCEQIFTIDKSRLAWKMGEIKDDILDAALSISLGIQKEWL